MPVAETPDRKTPAHILKRKAEAYRRKMADPVERAQFRAKAKQIQRAWYLKNREKKLAQCHAYRKAHSDDVRKWAKAWSKNNPDRRKAAADRYRESHRKIMQARTEVWHANNWERHLKHKRDGYKRLTEEQREVRRANMRKYHKTTYALRGRELSMERRARKESATVNPARILEWMRVIRSKPTAVCYYCGKTIPTKGMHIDHVVALKRGGAHAIENLAIACEFCNLSKNARFIHEWERPGQQVLSL